MAAWPPGSSRRKSRSEIYVLEHLLFVPFLPQWDTTAQRWWDFKIPWSCLLCLTGWVSALPNFVPVVFNYRDPTAFPRRCPRKKMLSFSLSTKSKSFSLTSLPPSFHLFTSFYFSQGVMYWTQFSNCLLRMPRAQQSALHKHLLDKWMHWAQKKNDLKQTGSLASRSCPLLSRLRQKQLPTVQDREKQARTRLFPWDGSPKTLPCKIPRDWDWVTIPLGAHVKGQLP